jgi:hypothetical protein
MTQNLKLTIELVPQTSWYSNMRSLVTRSEWDKIRKNAYAEYGHKCGICGASGKLNCHEIWDYDDKTHFQNLAGFIALCDLCHHVKHIGLAGILADQGKLDYDAVVEHFMKVNDCNRKVFEQHKIEAFAQWRERSQHQWTVDLGEFKSIAKQK